MKLFYHAKDGGPDSTVEGWWLVEIKGLFSIVLLKFNNGSRVAYHNHAFNAISWYLKGDAVELTCDKKGACIKKTRWKGLCFPKFTPREQIHKVVSNGDSWCLSVRGPWRKTWKEYLFFNNGLTMETLFTYGRKIQAISFK